MSTSYFYGVYLLCSKSSERRYSGRCYIGFTVNPIRRIKQHNLGKDCGGAKRTSNKGPWQMVLIVYGFPNNIAALQFEWAWQQPAQSSRLKPYLDLRRKTPKESYFQYNFRILSRMLNVGPWHRLPLTVCWLEREYECDFMLKPPVHMHIVSDDFMLPKSQTSLKVRSKESTPPIAIWAPECHLCMQRIDAPERSRIGCINALCKLTCHIICLANYILADSECNRGYYIPIAGMCPLCEEHFTWAELLQRKRKLQAKGVKQIEEEEEDDDDDIDRYESDLSDDSTNVGDIDNNIETNDYYTNSSHIDENAFTASLGLEEQNLGIHDDIVYALSD